MSALPTEIPKRHSLVEKFASKYSLEPAKLLTTLKATAFKVKDGEATNEQMAALLVVADQYGLNPFTKEIYAFPDSRNGIVPVVGVDGWARIVNEHPQFDGMEFVDGPCDEGTMPAWMECIIYRKDREHPVRVREYLSEVKRDTQPWKSHPRRMLRHKAFIQCARLALSFAGIYDEDEAERIVEHDVTPQPAPEEKQATRTSSIKDKLRPAPAVVEGELVRQDAVIDLATVVGYIERAKSREIALECLDLANKLPPEEIAAAKQEFDKRWPGAE